MTTPLQLTVRCDITGQASPRWQSARSEHERIENNEVLARHRADAFLKEFRSALSSELGSFKLKFLTDVDYGENDQPDQTVLVGATGVGQRESLVSAGGDRKNDDPSYRKVDVVVRIARSTQDDMPTKVTQEYERSTKSKFWYVQVGMSGSITAVAGFEMFRLKLTNWKGDVAWGSVVAVSGGLGLKYSLSTYSWTEEASFHTNREVGFEDFHGTRVRYTNAGLVIGIGYARSYLTFYGMGPGAASLHVGGFQTGLQASADFSEGLLVLDTVPSNYTIDKYDATEWQSIRSDWITKQQIVMYYKNAQWTLEPDQIARIKAFAKIVATDIRSGI